MTGFVQGTKTNGSGPGQFRDVVRPRRVNLKAKSQVVRIYVCSVCMCVYIQEQEKIRETSTERIIVKHLFVSLFYEFEHDTIYHTFRNSATGYHDTADIYEAI